MKTTLVFGALILALVGFAAPALAADVDPKLNPPGTPAPTMKTLDQIPPTWDQVLPAADRFKLVMPTTAHPSGEAVLDKETGLVWEKSPITSTRDWAWSWSWCFEKTVGGRKGWRLPTIEELASLVDPTASYPPLPTGHPFTSVQSSLYWSATTLATSTSYAWGMSFGNGHVYSYGKTTAYHTWCVRAGHGHDGQ